MVPHRTGHDWFHRLLRPFGLHGLAVAASALSMSLSVGLPMSVPVRTVAMPDLMAEGFDPQPALMIPIVPAPVNAHPYPEALALPDSRQQSLAEWPNAWDARPDPSPSSPSSPTPRMLMPGAVVSGLMLGVEQLHAARFIADKYRLPIDEIAEVVANAYFTARELRLDPLLVLAVIGIESGFDRRARSDKGAEGLMQIRTMVHTDKFLPYGGREAAFDPVVNIQVGATMLRDHLLREGSVEGALKSYVGAARRRHDGGYAVKVMRERDALQQALAMQMQARLSAGRP